MNAQVLIDGVVRHTTILIAQLATSGGVRAPLAHIANQIFLELAREVESQGVSKQVSADMFGLALRSYRRRLFRLGAGKDLAYRAATSAELAQLGRRKDGIDEIAWLFVYREGPLSQDDLAARLPVMRDDLPAPLARLFAGERVWIDQAGRYSARSVVMEPGASEGWEAGMLHHFQAVVKTLCARLRASAEDEPSPHIGGSTYSVRIWPGHPMEHEVRGLLAVVQKKAHRNPASHPGIQRDPPFARSLRRGRDLRRAVLPCERTE